MAVRSECQSQQDGLSDLYRLAIEEYHFNVKLWWDRTRFFAGLNAVLVTAAAAAIRFLDRPGLLLIPVAILAA